ncbi:MAG: TonB-dependent receptor plug domain-containing protein, partial [Polymorphobacter sp.]
MINNTASLSRAALKTSAASIVLAIGFMSAPSFAQTAAAAPGQVALTEADTGEAIIVTGSRIARPDLDTASPIQILGQQEFQLSGAVNVEEVLLDLPQVYPSTTGASNNPGGGVATADLRGLGSQRTLVLVNGRRWMSYDVSQVVDLNTIPAALIKRADVLTGGRGAVYGSDAIAGVVNFVLNDEFEGAQVDMGYRLNQAGDGGTFNVEATIGTNFANGKGNVTVNGSYTQRDPVFQGDREFSEFAITDNGDGTTSKGGSGSIPQLRYTINQSKAGPAVPGCANTANTRNRMFNPDGTTRGYCSTSDAYNSAPDNYLQVPQERWFMGGFAKYEVNEHAEMYTELAYVNNVVRTQLASTPSGGLNFRIPTNSPFFAPSTQAEFKALDVAQTNTITSYNLVDAPNDGYVTIGQARRFVESGPRAQDYNNSAFRALAGLRGEISGNWRYDGYYSYSRTDQLITISGDISQQRMANALDTTGTTLGTVACANGDSACVPLNFYGAGNISPAAAGYIAYSGLKNQRQITEQVANFAISNGDLVDLGWG